MLKKSLATAMMLGVLSQTAFAGNPVGHYLVEGKNFDGESTYTGTVDVTKTDATYQIRWVIGDKTTIGTAIGNKEFLAITYKSGDDSGIALYVASSANWDGVWTYAGGTTVSTEKWVRK